MVLFLGLVRFDHCFQLDVCHAALLLFIDALSIRAGDDIKTIQENMGHYSAAFTLDRYGHVTETMRQESANRMQAFIQGMSGNGGGNS